MTAAGAASISPDAPSAAGEKASSQNSRRGDHCHASGRGGPPSDSHSPMNVSQRAVHAISVASTAAVAHAVRAGAEGADRSAAAQMTAAAAPRASAMPGIRRG